MIELFTIYNIENILLPILSLLIGCIYQLYSILYIYAYSDVQNKVQDTSSTAIIITSIINVLLLIINFYKVVNLILNNHIFDFFILICVVLLIISGLLITILPGIYFNNKPNRNIFCACDNGLAEFTYIPSKNLCCKKCNPGYKMKIIDDNKLCVIDK